jgi:hypothetical protein
MAPSYADIPCIAGEFQFNPTGLAQATPATIINQLLPWIFALAGLLLLAYLLYGGLQILTSVGRPKAIASGVATITRAVIGFLVLFLSYWLIQIVEIIFSANII